MSKKMLTSLKGRKCRHRRCKNVLSIYNHDVFCHVHSDRLFQEKQSSRK